MHQIISPVIPLLFLLLAAFSCSYAAPALKLRRGFGQTPEHGEELLRSLDGTFTCGFNKVGTNAYSFSIWYSNSTDRTVVWTANRDSPVKGRGSRIALQLDGNLILKAADGSRVWDTGTSFMGVSIAELLETGNLVLKDATDVVKWQSFDYPTDTLLPRQWLTKGKRLVSPVSRGALSAGNFVLNFDNDNVLRIFYDGPEISSIYWPSPDYSVFELGRTDFNSTRVAFLDDAGRFQSSDGLNVTADDSGDPGIKRRLSMDYNGRLRIYSLNASSGRWIVSWEALPQLCNVHGLCGKNGICEYLLGLTKCSCAPGYEMVDTSNWNKGCKPKFNLQACHDLTGENARFVEVPYTSFYGFDMNIYSTSTSLYSCRNSCAMSCSCLGFSYGKTGTGDCYLSSALFNGYRSTNFPRTFFLKWPKNVSSSLATDTSALTCNYNSESGDQKNMKWIYFYVFACALGTLELLLIITGWWFIFARQGTSKSLEEGYRMISMQFRSFTYGELKEATGKFKEVLGRGGSGIVYRGVLEDKKIVAVKKLTNATQGEEEFWAEVSVIGRINHMNLVRMWGFCSEGPHRLLVYEYVENQSLDKYLFGDGDSGGALGWNQRFKIALGTARGLAYLHHECLEWVIHCDVKPENILLDRVFEAKIADFGLAKLSERDDAGLEVSRLRGTMGYMAPEWTLNLPITGKVDVYSYGIVLLEILSGNRVSSWATVDGKHKGVRKLVAELKELVRREDASGIKDVVDGRLNGLYDQEEAMAMLRAAASCLEENPSRRPTMNDILEILMSAGDEEEARSSPS